MEKLSGEQEQEVSQSGGGTPREVAASRKISVVSSRRFLKDHNLDQLLVYNKRDSKRRRDFQEQCAERSRNLQLSKKQRKKTKLQAKILENKSAFQLDKSKQKTNEQPDQPLQPTTTHTNPTNPLHKKKNQLKDTLPHRYSSQDSSDPEEFKFPLVNNYYSSHSQEFLDTMARLDRARQHLGKPPTGSTTFINCDVRYFNWDLFSSQAGKFDVVVIDPPWRIKGAQKNDSPFMFSNCRFSLEYNTMSNHQIRQLPLHYLSDEGFIFLWILNTQFSSSLEIMQAWGYELVEEIAWVKLRKEKIYLTHGYYFMHSYELCLIGYKNTRKDGHSMLLRHGVNPNVVFGDVRKKSQKPEDIYNIIEMVFKGKRKLEIFARNHNLRFGVFSIGNQLGEAYDKWMLHLHCDDCQKDIKPKTKRYKSKTKANYDVCEECIQTHNKQMFFQFANEVDEDVRHEYLACNMCGVEPVWGIRFKCLVCSDYDLCESCFDQYLLVKTDANNPNKLHPDDHEFRTLEIPVFGSGFAIHEYKCNACYQYPIIGVCLSCTTCKNFKLCQKCFFERSIHERRNGSKAHRSDHEFQAMFEPQLNDDKKYECFSCKKIIQEGCFMCQNCYNFFFCEECYSAKETFKSLYANAHKKYHVFSKMF